MAHFYDALPAALTALSHAAAVERYARGGQVPGEAIAGLSREQLSALPIPGTWSIQQIVFHLMDNDLIASYRMKRIIAEDGPLLDVYDESAFPQRLFYDRLDAQIACEVFRLNRHLTAEILRQLPEDAYQRVAIHPEVGEMTLGRLVRLYVHHLEHHLAFICEKRCLVEESVKPGQSPPGAS